MKKQLKAKNLNVEWQKRFDVKYKAQIIGKYILDTIVNGKIILEYKAVMELIAIHEQHALSYLKTTGLPLAIIIIFGTPRVQYRCIVSTTGKASTPSSSIRKQP